MTAVPVYAFGDAVTSPLFTLDLTSIGLLIQGAAADGATIVIVLGYIELDGADTPDFSGLTNFTSAVLTGSDFAIVYAWTYREIEPFPDLTWSWVNAHAPVIAVAAFQDPDPLQWTFPAIYGLPGGFINAGNTSPGRPTDNPLTTVAARTHVNVQNRTIEPEPTVGYAVPGASAGTLIAVGADPGSFPPATPLPPYGAAVAAIAFDAGEAGSPSTPILWVDAGWPSGDIFANGFSTTVTLTSYTAPPAGQHRGWLGFHGIGGTG